MQQERHQMDDDLPNRPEAPPDDLASAQARRAWRQREAVA